MTNQNAQQHLLQEISLLLLPLRAAIDSKLALQELAASVGWDLDEIAGLPINELVDSLSQLVESYEQLANLVEHPPETLFAFLEGLAIADQVFTAMRRVDAILDRPNLRKPPQFEAFGRDLIHSMTVSYVQAWQPIFYHLAVLLTLIQSAEDIPLSAPVFDAVTGKMVRFPYVQPQLRLERIADLLEDPIALLKQEYLGPNGLVTATDAKYTADKLFSRLANFLDALGIQAVYGVKPIYGFDFGRVGNTLAAQMLTAWVSSDSQDQSFGLTLALSPAEQGNLGLVIIPFGNFNRSDSLGEWFTNLTLTGGTQAFAVGSNGLQILANGSQSRVEAGAELVRLPDGESIVWLVGSATGTRLEVGQLLIKSEVRFQGSDRDYGFLFEASSAALVIMPSDGDGFLQSVLPAKGLRIDFNLAFGWSNRQGFCLAGSTGLEAQLAIHRSIAGVLRIDWVHLALQTHDRNLHSFIATTIRLQFGPFMATIDRVGLKTTLSFPPEGGNLGVADLALAFKSPSSIGLSIDSATVVGAGYLFFDPDTQSYAGLVQLEFNQLALTAIGLLTTRMPNGSKGFSLVVIISADDFTPINLGLGFTLNGVGGLLGVNRTVAVDRLRQGMKQRSLDAVLFPADPVRNAPQIVSNLQTVFPAAPGQYLFGPMAIIGWGTPTILTAEIGIILEFPSPIRLLVLGQFRALLPSENKPLVRLQMDAIGVFDFDQETAAIDATLYDSRLSQFTLTGDMALRLNWGSHPTFLLAVGGLNPNFDPPANFPKLDRLAISLTSGNNPRIRLECYLALTSNTVQIGARVDLYAEAAGFSIEGYLGFDALFQFSPFQFVVQIVAGVALKRGKRKLMSVQLDLLLSGPSPWHVRGKATFKILFFKASVSFDKTFGTAEQSVLPTIDLLPELRQALADPRNWSAQLPKVSSMLVSLRKIPVTDQILVHPLGHLTVRQRVVPLNVEISRLGSTRPSGDRRFTLTTVKLNNAAVSDIEPVTEHFAPAQYIEMDDSEKLSRPSFEPMQAGIQFGTDAITYGGMQDAATQTPKLMATASLDYKTYIVNGDRTVQPTQEPYTVPTAILGHLAATSAVGRAPVRRKGKLKYANAGVKLAVAESRYVIATRNDLTLQNALPDLNLPSSGTSYTQVREALQHYLSKHPKERDRLQVIRQSEVRGGRG